MLRLEDYQFVSRNGFNGGFECTTTGCYPPWKSNWDSVTLAHEHDYWRTLSGNAEIWIEASIVKLIGKIIQKRKCKSAFATQF